MEKYQNLASNIIRDAVTKFDNPEHLPVLTEIISTMLVKAATASFEPPKPPKKNTSKRGFSKDLTAAWRVYNIAFKQFTAAGRPTENTHPAKMARDEARAELRKIRRTERNAKSERNHNDLMETHRNNIVKVSKKLSQLSGGNKSPDLDYIDTLNGRYSGDNILEGFCSNAETLATPIENPEYCSEFYNMVCEDNNYILEFSSDQTESYPLMSPDDLRNILFKKLKLNKASDVYQLSVEHLRYAGDETLGYILATVNKLLDHVNYLASPEVKTGCAPFIYKGKKKPVNHHKSYRRVTVGPLIGRIVDEHIRARTIPIYTPQQNINQYGFTEGVDYKLSLIHI